MELTPEECWLQHIGRAYVLIDATSLGLGRLLERLPTDCGGSAWPYHSALSRACSTGAERNRNQKSEQRLLHQARYLFL